MSDDWFGGFVAGAVTGVLGLMGYQHYTKPEVVPTYHPPRQIGMMLIGNDMDDALWQVNASTVTGNRDKRQGWAIVTVPAKDKGAIRSTKSLYQTDCGTTATRVLAIKFYDAKNQPVYPYAASPDSEVQYFAPDSMGSSIVRLLCDSGFDTPDDRGELKKVSPT